MKRRAAITVGAVLFFLLCTYYYTPIFEHPGYEPWWLSVVIAAVVAVVLTGLIDLVVTGADAKVSSACLTERAGRVGISRR